MIFQYFSAAHTVDLNKTDDDYDDFLAFLSAYRFGLAAKATRITMIFQCFFPRITLIKTKATIVMMLFLFLLTAKELSRV